jgi:arylsulfatase A-like enzyme
MRLRAHALLATATLALLAGASCKLDTSLEKDAATGPPNILLVVVDTLRADHLGAYGARTHLTPALDALAEEAYVFEKAFATSAWTKSSIASLFTGIFPSRLSVLGRQDALPQTAQPLAELLAAGGYQSYGVTTNGNAGAAFGFAQGFEAFEYPEMKRRYPDGATTFPAEGVTRTAMQWLAQRDPQRPFFVFLHYTDPHDPYLPHPGLIAGKEPAGAYDGSREQLEAMDAAYRKGELKEVDQERIRYLYAGEVKYCDLWIGNLIGGLRELGLWNDLLLVVTADHGEGLWDHGERAHGRDLFDEMIHVPLFLKYPRMSAAGAARVTTPISLVDIAPTILAAAGISEPSAIQGRDLRTLLDGDERSDPNDGIYAELSLDHVDLESLRTTEHKILRARKLPANSPGSYQLFDLRRDPGERDNLAPRAPEAVDEMKESLQRWRSRIEPAEPDESRRQVALEDLSPSELRSLRDLGYISDDEFRAAADRRERRAPGGRGG